VFSVAVTLCDDVETDVLAMSVLVTGTDDSVVATVADTDDGVVCPTSVTYTAKYKAVPLDINSGGTLQHANSCHLGRHSVKQQALRSTGNSAAFRELEPPKPRAASLAASL
jgi:hypothetical protein